MMPVHLFMRIFKETMYLTIIALPNECVVKNYLIIIIRKEDLKAWAHSSHQKEWSESGSLPFTYYVFRKSILICYLPCYCTSLPVLTIVAEKSSKLKKQRLFHSFLFIR